MRCQRPYCGGFVLADGVCHLCGRSASWGPPAPHEAVAEGAESGWTRLLQQAVEKPICVRCPCGVLFVAQGARRRYCSGACRRRVRHWWAAARAQPAQS